jgi:hypothetical protein
MVDWNHDIGAYLKDDTRSIQPLSRIFPNWTHKDYEEVCTRVEKACGEVGISLQEYLPRFPLKNSSVASDNSIRQRTAAVELLFGKYNHDGLLLLRHQKDPTIPAPSWFEDSVLLPGRFSIGQKLLYVSYSRIKCKNSKERKSWPQQTEHDEQPSAGTVHTYHRGLSPSQSDKPPTIQDVTSPSSATTEQGIVAVKQPSSSTPFARTPHTHGRIVSPTGSGNASTIQDITSPSSATTKQGRLAAKRSSSSGPFNTPAKVKSRRTASNVSAISPEDLTIHIGTIFEEQDGSLSMRRTLRNPESWTESSAPNRFDFEKVRHSVRVRVGWGKELYFFPDLSKDPHSILNEDELDGAIRCLYKQSVKEGVAGNISFFVAADLEHVRGLPLNQRSECTVIARIGSS